MDKSKLMQSSLTKKIGKIICKKICKNFCSSKCNNSSKFLCKFSSANFFAKFIAIKAAENFAEKFSTFNADPISKTNIVSDVETDVTEIDISTRFDGTESKSAGVPNMN